MNLWGLLTLSSGLFLLGMLVTGVVAFIQQNQRWVWVSLLSASLGGWILLMIHNRISGMVDPMVALVILLVALFRDTAALAARDAAHAPAKSAAATRHLLAAINPAKGRIISGFLPIGTEIDPLAAMENFHNQGARICVPVMTGGMGHPLEFREWTPGCALEEGPFGVMIPSNSCNGVKLMELIGSAVSHGTSWRRTCASNLDGIP